MGRVVYLLSKWCDWLAQGTVVAMMLFVCANVVLRVLWKPIQGASELVCLLSVIVTSFALSYCFIQKGHVAVELIVGRLPQRARAITDNISGILSIGIFAIMAWSSGVLAMDVGGNVSDMLGLYLAPFVGVISFCCLLLCLAVLVKVLKSLAKVSRK